MTMTINGTGSITGLSAGGLPDATIQQSDLAANVAGNGPAFSAYQSVAHSFGTNVFVKVQLQTEEFDTSSAFDSTTNYRFQPTVAGLYRIAGTVGFGTATSVIVSIYKNDVEFKRGSQTTASTNLACVDSLVSLNGTTDYVELYAQQGAAAQNSLASQAFTYFHGFLARAA